MLAINAARATLMAVELGDPAIRQRVGRARRAPTRSVASAASPPSAAKNGVEKKWQCASFVAAGIHPSLRYISCRILAASPTVA